VTLRRLGYAGSDADVLARVSREDEHLLRLCASASAMWAANAATVAPSCDTADARVHVTPANLHCMFHRAIEAETTYRVLSAIFSDPARFAVHAPLPGGGQFADEGAANHTRLFTDNAALQIFGYGRRHYGDDRGPRAHPARQTLEASHAIARLHRLDPSAVVFARQSAESADAIDAGAFHSDVVAVGNGNFLMVHELAFADTAELLSDLRKRLGDSLSIAVATEDELPVRDAVAAYPFNSQLVTLPSGEMAIIAPEDSRELASARRFLERVRAEDNPVSALHFLDVRQSMHNGGGPACLRLRVPLTDAEVAAIPARVLFSDALDAALTAWIQQHYRDQLRPAELADPELWRDCMAALDQLTGILGLGSVYEFQR
jgi:succinylarginine dihydrolase